MKKYFYIVIVFSTLLKAQSINWINIESVFEKAKYQKKIVLVFFKTDWCKWCKEMEKATFNNPEIIKYINKHFVVAQVNPEKAGGEIKVNNITYNYKEFTLTSKVNTYPSCGFYSPHGYMIQVLKGFWNEEDLLNALKNFIENTKK